MFCQKLTDGNIELGLDELGGISQWESGKTYKVDSIVVYSDIIYKCKTANSDTIFNENNWTALGNSSRVQSWKSAENYEPFQLLEDNENLYMVVKPHTSTTIEADEANKKIKRIDTDLTAIGGANTTAQVTKLGVVAPKSVTIPIEKTELFNFSPIGVLKFKSGGTGVVSTVNDFSNADKNDFNDNEYVEFDGAMKLKNIMLIDKTTITSLPSGETVVESETVQGDKLREVLI